MNRITVILRLTSIALLAAAALFTARQELWTSFTVLLLLIIGIMATVCHAIDRPYRLMQNFIDAVRVGGDLSFHITGKNRGNDERQLAFSMNEMLAIMKKRMIDNEKRMCYYETLLNRVDSSLLVVREDGEVVWQNDASVRDLCGHAVHQIKELASLNEKAPLLLQELKAGDVITIPIKHRENVLNMAATVTLYVDNGLALRLINLRNIHSLLEENELDAWRKLIRVLTHEIMNSLTPIISLSETLNEQPQEEEVLKQALHTIERRSKGLLCFVENYRKLTKIPLPQMKPVRVADLFEDIKRLLNSQSTDCTFDMENEHFRLSIDRSQIEQVLLNLIKNSMEACIGREEVQITVDAALSIDGNEYRIRVADNGSGILPEVQEKVFVPFFTTKPGGSGIGLSLCKQIMSLHGGNISLQSVPDKGSCFTLHFKTFTTTR